MIAGNPSAPLDPDNRSKDDAVLTQAHAGLPADNVRDYKAPSHATTVTFSCAGSANHVTELAPARTNELDSGDSPFDEFAGRCSGAERGKDEAVNTINTALTREDFPSDWDGLARDYGLLAAREAPVITEAWMSTAERGPALILVPIAHADGEACAMINLQEPRAIFGAARDERQGGAEQGAILATHLNGACVAAIESQYEASTPFYGANDAIILVPWATRPTFVARSVAHVDRAREAPFGAPWTRCTTTSPTTP
jgi:hypothetical protein